MLHMSENSSTLKRQIINCTISLAKPEKPNLEFVIFPYYEVLEEMPDKSLLFSKLEQFIYACAEGSTIAVLCSPAMAADFCSTSEKAHLKLWIAVKHNMVNENDEDGVLKQKHSALLIFTKYNKSLNHTKTRIAYKYCPSCNKTTKDYGGKKHLYHEFGTLLPDVWRDINVDWNSELPENIIERLQDLFGLPEYTYINIYDERKYTKQHFKKRTYKHVDETTNILNLGSKLINGDCLEVLKEIPDNCIDFSFADPPYNIKKKYESWNDSLEIQQYFDWCDKWLTELARVLKPGRTLAVLNIPQWSIRYFKFLISILDYQDWIVWESMSLPVRKIMPSHYTILCFTKGKPRKLPGLSRDYTSLGIESLLTLKQDYCTRISCVNKRRAMNINDKETISNLWWDIHRLKHNSRRVDHPTQLPPALMLRLISLFTDQEEIVLDPFNGVGTTTLTAEQLDRKYIGIEISDYYHKIAVHRHYELSCGLDPFRKNGEEKKAKNSRVKRLKKQKYKVTKKELQLEIKKITAHLGYIPAKDEVAKLCKYPIEYYEEYFVDWGEVTAAARTTGMTEDRSGQLSINFDSD